MEGGSTALILASRSGHVDLAWLPIEGGTNVSTQNKDRLTALHLALGNGHAACRPHADACKV